MSRWLPGEAQIDQLIATKQLLQVIGGQANGAHLLQKASRTLATAGAVPGEDPDSAYVLAYDAARYSGTAILAQQGLRLSSCCLPSPSSDWNPETTCRNAGPCGPRVHVDCTKALFASKRVGSTGNIASEFDCPATFFACGAGDGNRTRTVSVVTVRTHGCVLGALRVSRSRAAWVLPWTPPLMAREWHGCPDAAKSAQPRGGEIEHSKQRSLRRDCGNVSYGFAFFCHQDFAVRRHCHVAGGRLRVCIPPSCDDRFVDHQPGCRICHGRPICRLREGAKRIERFPRDVAQPRVCGGQRGVPRARPTSQIWRDRSDAGHGPSRQSATRRLDSAEPAHGRR